MIDVLAKATIEQRAYAAAVRIFGRYGVDVANPDIPAGDLRRAMARMSAAEHQVIIGAFAAVIKVNGRFSAPTPPKLTEVQMYDNLQARARHFANHHEDLPKPPLKAN